MQGFFRHHARLCVTLWVALIAGVASAADDIGIINQLAGEVGYQSSGSAGARAGAFMRVREGDAFKLAAGARLRLVYFDSGRQETWEGPAEFSAGRREGAGKGGRVSATQLPGGVPAALGDLSELMKTVRVGKPGAVTLRGFKPPLSAEQQAALQKARDQYKALGESAAADDITPELYMLGVLRQYGLNEEIRQVAARMQAKDPNSPEVRDINAWAGTLGAR
jgi:hypothetical protein